MVIGEVKRGVVLDLGVKLACGSGPRKSKVYKARFQNMVRSVGAHSGSVGALRHIGLCCYKYLAAMTESILTKRFLQDFAGFLKHGLES